MQAAELIAKSKDAEAWRKHARALRRSGDAIWQRFEKSLFEALAGTKDGGAGADLDVSVEYLETAKLLYGLALETALKAWIIKQKPGEIEIGVTIDGSGEAVHAELKRVGVRLQGHDLHALAESAGLFGTGFSAVITQDSDRDAVRTICRDLGQAVAWRGRYPAPRSSFEPQKLKSGVPVRVLTHYLRDWLDPVLDALLNVDATAVVHVDK